MDIRLALMAGIDIPIPELQLTIHQPTIKEIAFIGDTDFFIGSQCLTVDKKLLQQDETLLENTNNFQIFMTIMTEKESIDKRKATLQVLEEIGFKLAFVGGDYKATRNNNIYQVPRYHIYRETSLDQFVNMIS